MSVSVSAPIRRARTRFQAAIEDRPIGSITVFLLPALTIYLLFTAYPVILTIFDSFHYVVPRAADKFIGLRNYVHLLSRDSIFWHAVTNTVIWALLSPAFEITIGLFLALALYARVPGSRFFRVAWFTPVLMSYVVVGIIWMWIYNADWGIANEILRLIGLGQFAQAWLGDTRTALPALIVVTTWMWTGFNMVVLLAAMHSLPTEVLEAAELDGCGWLGKLWFVAIPMIRPTIMNLVILSFIGKMRLFDLVWVTTRGGPLWSTETVSTYVYKRAFNWDTFDLGYPSAIATIWFVVVLAGVLGLTYLLRSRERLEY